MRRAAIRILCAVLILCACSFAGAFAETVTTTSTYHRLDTGVMFLWSNSAGVWQNGLAPGDTAELSRVFSLPAQAKNVKVAAYNPEASEGGSGYFDFRGGKYYAYNVTASSTSGDAYNTNYYAYACNPLRVSGADTYDPNTGNIDVSYTMTFRAAWGQPYNLKAKLAAGEKKEIYALLGNPSADISEKMNLLDPASETYNPEVEGYMFFIPIVLSYDMVETTEQTEEESPDPETPTEPNVEMEGEARLSIVPDTVYEGHTVEAQDVSGFTVDGVIYNAARMYEEGLARAVIAPEQTAGAASVKKNSVTSEITFPNVGEYRVDLSVKMKNGVTLRDAQYVDVRATPDIQAALSGTQKQNRKQLLHVRIYTHPERPLKQLYIEIRTEEGSERVRLDSLIGNEQSNKSDNSQTIKTRPIELVSTSAYFTEVQLPFLTKNEIEQNFSYNVFARDSAGHSTDAAASFKVRPDLPPEAVVETAETHIREEGSNYAHIEVSDRGSSDGDAVRRVWYADIGNTGRWTKVEDIEGIEDLSFGSMRTFCHKKEGVGEVSYRLEVYDVWTEETLEEYVSAEDYLSSCAEASTDVINIAPKVSLSALPSEKGEMLMLARTSEEETLFKSAAQIADAELIEAGIDADITVDTLNPIKQAMTDVKEPTAVNTFSGAAYGWYGEDTMLEKDWYLADSKRFYTLEATWSGTRTAPPYLDTPKQPAYVTAYDLQSGTVLWRNTVGAGLLDMQGFKESFVMASDDGDLYLLIGNGVKTLIFDKGTGMLLASVDIGIGYDNYVRNNRIYTLREDGIYSINTANGIVKQVFDGEICLNDGYCDKRGYSRICGKCICFASKQGAELLRVSFDPLTEKFTAGELATDILISAPYTVLGFDSQGKLALAQKDKSQIFVFDTDGKLIKHISEAENAQGRDAVCAFNGDGIFTHIVTADNHESSGSKTSTYTISATAYPLSGGQPLTYTHERKASNAGTSGNGTDAERTVFAAAFGDKVVLCSGDRATSISDGSSLGSYYFTSASQILFDFAARTTQRSIGGGSYYEELQIGGKISEYGKQDDNYWISAYSWGHAGADYTSSPNGQSAKVAVLPESVDSMIARAVFKDIKSSSSRRGEAALFMTNGSDVGQRTLENLNKAGAYLLIDDGSAAEIADAICSYFKRDSKRISVFKAVPTAAGASLSKSYDLDPDTTYYFEYAVKSTGIGQPATQDTGDFDSNQAASSTSTAATEATVSGQEEEGGNALLPTVEIIQNSLLPEELCGTGAYYVSEIHEEDFEDKSTDSFFGNIDAARITSGRYRASYQDENTGKGHSSRSLQDNSTITFTVPEGKSAVLSFDYDIDLYGPQAWFAAHLVIKNEDGTEQKWGNCVSDDKQGHYTHPTFLKEGENTLEFYSADYSTRYFNSHFIIDNLRVTFVETDQSYTLNPKIAVDRRSDGWAHISGNFVTPPEVISYRQRDGEYIKGSLGTASNTEVLSTDPANKQYRLQIPSGMRAAFVRLDTVSQPYGSSKKEYDLTYTAGGFNWISSAVNKTAEDTYYNIGNAYRITLLDISGSQIFKVASPLPTASVGNYTQIEAMLIRGSDALTGEMRYFCADADGDGSKELYAESEVFGGAKLSIPIGAEGAYIKDFKLYCIKDGLKIYVDTGEPSSVTNPDGASDESGAQGESGAGKWQCVACTLAREIIDTPPEKIDPPATYKKGELVNYGVTYSDYENDPSKREYWRYTHIHLNDGPFPDAGKILSHSIPRFYIDGTYTVEHWQEDSTGKTSYDKLSNIAEITFYVEGQGNPPWVEWMEIQPERIKAGTAYELLVGVNDYEKDELCADVSVTKDMKVIYETDLGAIIADERGNYPVQRVPLRAAGAGRYTINYYVRDKDGMGIGLCWVNVEAMPEIKGTVSHTAQWEENRLLYNSKHSENTRPQNYFWAGEQFVLKVIAEGGPTTVRAHIEGYPNFSETLKYTGSIPVKGAPDGEQAQIYEGILWNDKMAAMWRDARSLPLTFVFTASYEEGNEEIEKATVIMDNTGGGFRIHRTE